MGAPLPHAVPFGKDIFPKIIKFFGRGCSSGVASDRLSYFPQLRDLARLQGYTLERARELSVEIRRIAGRRLQVPWQPRPHGRRSTPFVGIRIEQPRKMISGNKRIKRAVQGFFLKPKRGLIKGSDKIILFLQAVIRHRLKDSSTQFLPLALHIRPLQERQRPSQSELQRKRPHNPDEKTIQRTQRQLWQPVDDNPQPAHDISGGQGGRLEVVRQLAASAVIDRGRRQPVEDFLKKFRGCLAGKRQGHNPLGGLFKSQQAQVPRDEGVRLARSR